MRTLEIYRNGVLAGQLIEENTNQYSFLYDLNYLMNEKCPAISLTLPKTEEKIKSNLLFPFFFNMLSEGVNRKLQSLYLRIDENDHFGLLAATAQTDTIGAITVKQI
jgi:serine/threonine-protein kinase HipA